MSSEQAAAMIELLTSIRDELQRPRLAREQADRAATEHQDRCRAEQVEKAAARVAADLASKPATIWAGGIGAGAYVRGGGTE